MYFKANVFSSFNPDNNTVTLEVTEIKRGFVLLGGLEHDWSRTFSTFEELNCADHVSAS